MALTRHLAGVRFRPFPERKHGAGELMLAQREKEITLVFALVATPFPEDASLFGPFQPREMAGGDELGSKLVSPFNQAPELEVLVAHHTRVGCAPGSIFVGKIPYHLFLELGRLVHEVIGNAELVAHGPRVAYRLWPAAFVLRARDTVLRPKLESDTDHIVALFQQQRGSRRGVNPAAHACHHPRFAGLNHRSK